MAGRAARTRAGLQPMPLNAEGRPPSPLRDTRQTGHDIFPCGESVGPPRSARKGPSLARHAREADRCFRGLGDQERAAALASIRRSRAARDDAPTGRARAYCLVGTIEWATPVSRIWSPGAVAEIGVACRSGPRERRELWCSVTQRVRLHGRSAGRPARNRYVGRRVVFVAT